MTAALPLPAAMALRLPLSPDRQVELAWPEGGVSETEWALMLTILEAMKPGLVRPPTPDVTETERAVAAGLIDDMRKEGLLPGKALDALADAWDVPHA